MVTIFSDGGSRGNPGKAASAFAIYNENKKLLHSDSKYLGITTNNVAEYNGVILALTWLTEEKRSFDFAQDDIRFCMDSELVVKQLSGVYKIKDQNLLQLAARVKKLITANNLKIKFVHVPRAENAYADSLVNENLDSSSRL
jgi:ribonuclease HI